MATKPSIVMKEEKSLVFRFIGLLIRIAVVAALWTWYNYVIIRFPINYWEWLVLSIPIHWLLKWMKPLKYVLGAIFFIALFAQLLHWFGVIQLPLLKL